MSEQQPQQPTVNSEETLSFSINDLATVRNIIDLASSRGAFKPGEMVTVGQTYNKLVAFLDAVVKQQTDAAAGEDSTQPSSDTEEGV